MVRPSLESSHPCRDVEMINLGGIPIETALAIAGVDIAGTEIKR